NERFKVVRRYEKGVALPAFVLGGAKAILEARKIPNLHGVILWNANGVRSTDLTVPLLLINSDPIDAFDVTRVSGGDDRLAAKLAKKKDVATDGYKQKGYENDHSPRGVARSCH